MAENKSNRVYEGRVVSNKMDKSIAVLIERRVKHPVYGKFIRRSTKILAHDQNNDCQINDIVLIQQCRPISKNKKWSFIHLVNRSDLS